MWGALIILMNIVKLVKQKLNLYMDNSPPPVELSESSQTIVVSEAGLNNNSGNHGDSSVGCAQTMMWMKWPLLVIGVCLAAISVVLQALQTTGPLPKAISHLEYMLLVTFLTVVMVSIYIRPNYPRESDVLLHVSAFLGAAALVVPLVSKLPFILMVTSIAIITSGILVVIVASLFKPTAYIRGGNTPGQQAAAPHVC